MIADLFFQAAKGPCGRRRTALFKTGFPGQKKARQQTRLFSAAKQHGQTRQACAQQETETERFTEESPFLNEY